MIASNPFTPQSGWEPKEFGGRIEEISLFENALTSAKTNKIDHIVLLGEWGIGKTSLLKYFKKLAQKNGFPSMLCPIGRFTEKDRTIDGINLILEELNRIFPSDLEDTTRRTAKPIQPQTLLTNKLLSLYKAIKASLIVILLDDVQNFSKISEVIDIIRLVLSRDEIIENTKYLFVLSSTPEGWQYFIDKHSPVGRFFREKLILSNLTEEEVFEIVKKTLINTGVHFSDEIIKDIYKYTNGHPYELQLLSSNLYESQIEGKVNAKTQWERALSDTLRDLGKDYFESLYRQITEREKPILEVMAKENSPLDIKEIKDLIWSNIRQYKGYPLRDVGSFIHRLEDKGIVKKVSRGKYEIFDRMFLEYFAKRE
ncbi:MAG: ATP-binding protein [Candidatus Omnitrophica bacterium]|nr:ATP-binding protein [Candidatus Omnitrophota bacterium]